MATPKFDRIAIAFMAKVKDTFVTAFTAGGGAIPVGYVLINDGQISSYVNRALQKFFGDAWAAAIEAKGIDVFLNMFPELGVIRTVTLDGSAEHTFISPNLDIFHIVNALVDTKSAQMGRKSLYTVAKSGSNFHYKGDANTPLVFYLDSAVHVFPQATFPSKSAEMVVVKKPVDPTTGALLIQNGSYDSPFEAHWEDKLSELAYRIYLTDSQSES